MGHFYNSIAVGKMESLRAVIFISAILVNTQASYGYYQPITYRPSPLDSNNNLNILKEFNRKFWNDQKGLSYSFNPAEEVDQVSVINYEKEKKKIQKPVLINQNIWNNQKGLSYRFNPEVETDQSSVINQEKERNKIQTPVLINQKNWNDQKGLSYRFNPEVEIDQSSVINQEKERNRIQEPVLINPLNVDNTFGSYDLKRIFSIPQLNIKQAKYIKPVAMPKKLGALRQSRKRINNFNSVGNNLAMLPWNKELNSHNHISRTSFQIRHSKQTHSVSGKVGTTHINSNPQSILPQEEKFAEIENTNKASDLIKQPIDANEIIEPPKPALRDIPSLYGFSLKADEQPKTFLYNRRLNAPLEAYSQVKGLSAGLSPIDLLGAIADLQNQQKTQPNDQDSTNIKEDLVTDFIINNFLSKEMADLISAAKTEEEKKKVVMAMKNYKMMTHALIDFIRYSNPLTGHINSLKLISENEVPGSGVTTSTLEEVFEDESKAARKREPGKEEPEKESAENDENAQVNNNSNAGFHIIHDHRIHGPDSLQPDKEQLQDSLKLDKEQVQDSLKPNKGQVSDSLKPNKEQRQDSLKPNKEQRQYSLKPNKEQVQDSLKPDKGQFSESLKPEKDDNIKRTSKYQADENIGRVVVIPFGSEEINDQKELNNTSSESLEKPQGGVDIEPIEPIEPLGPLRPRKTKKIKTLKKEELETFMKNLQVRKKIDDAFCEKLKTNEAIGVMESIIRDFIEDLSYRFDKDVIMNTAEFSVNRNLHYQRDSEQDCFYY